MVRVSSSVGGFRKPSMALTAGVIAVATPMKVKTTAIETKPTALRNRDFRGGGRVAISPESVPHL